jgi:hypothetical protein
MALRPVDSYVGSREGPLGGPLIDALQPLPAESAAYRVRGWTYKNEKDGCAGSIPAGGVEFRSTLRAMVIVDRSA